ncbi:MAG: hypothetical protein KDA22_10415, partial [Phycisphaerales bacterium]|nr:hypothetical protein [Phycisphaerales bacterium]
VTLFFDGHVSAASTADAMDADQRASNDSGHGLWSRDTPLGANGYYGSIAYDWVVDTSYHVLTIDGILGRDFLGAR